MDRSGLNGPPVVMGEDATGNADPFKERMEKGGRKRAERRDPRIQPPREGAVSGVAAPAALEIIRNNPFAPRPVVQRPDAFAGTGARPADLRPVDSKPSPKPATSRPAAPNPVPRPVAPERLSASSATGVGAAASAPVEVIIPPGEVFADPSAKAPTARAWAFLGRQKERPKAVSPDPAILAPAIAPTLAGALPVQHISATGTGLAPSRTSIKAFAPAAPTPLPKPRAQAAVAAGERSDDRQDDLATGAIAALFLLLAGWMGAQALSSMGAPRAAPTPEPDAGPLAAVASAAAPAPAPAPTATAPLDLTPSSAVVAPTDGLVMTPATAALDIPLSPRVFASYSVASALAVAAAPRTEAAPPISVSCDPNMVMRTYFCTAQTSLTASSRAMLERELANLRTCAQGREILVTGYADSRGLAVRNAALSEGRAESVAQFLRAQGLAVVTVAAAGEASGLEDDKNCAHQRRVDISFAGSAPPPSLACAAPAAASALTCG